jgi:8-amino-7-oxononanoate synthase
VPLATPHAALAAQAAALEAGVRVGCFRPPSTPDGVSRLRVTANAGLSDDDWRLAAAVVVRVVREHA